LIGVSPPTGFSITHHLEDGDLRVLGFQNAFDLAANNFIKESSLSREEQVLDCDALTPSAA